MKKYKLTEETKKIGETTLYRIESVRDFNGVKKGDLGGWVENKSNLSQNGNCWVYDNANVYGNAWVFGDASVSDKASVFGNAVVYGEAKINENMKISTGKCSCDLSKNLKENIRCQCNLLVIDNKVIAYKQVRKDLTSFYNREFKYEIGKIAEVKEYDKSNESCSEGLHFSNPNYWNENVSLGDSVFLMAEIKLKDIITVQEGKIRCKKAKILGKYEIEKENE